MVNKLRPVDQLRQLLLNNMGADCPAVENFFRLHKVRLCVMHMDRELLGMGLSHLCEEGGTNSDQNGEQKSVKLTCVWD